MARPTTYLQIFVATLLMSVFFLALGSAPAEAKSCGGKGQKPCPIWHSGPVCNPGLGDINDKCTPCGRAGQRSCPAMTKGPQCEKGLEKHNGKCVRCGGKDQIACSWLQPGRRCGKGLGKFGDYCRPCGKDNQKACPKMEQGAPCEQGLREVDDRCVACGGKGQRICRIIDKGPACKDGLEINLLTQKCQPEEPGAREKTLQRYEQNKADIGRRQTRLTQALATVSENPPPGELPSSGDNTVQDTLDGIFIGADDQARRDMMKRYLENDDVMVVTLMTGGSGSIIVGYGYSSGWAMKARGGPGQPFNSNASAYECRAIKTHVATGGLSAGFSGTVEIGEWNGDFDLVNGKSNGVQAMATVLAAGWGAGAHFGKDGGASGATVINGGSAGAELTPIEYVHGWTTVEDEETNCDEISW
ncbi:hypothetical protein ACFOOP_02805 [Marinicaulis aureus]|uniref:Uncharacterized protein n=1 Tax=Hyphococcus aureus TaxID=2666033 RepID=A0ABW1KXF3_9PROT